MPSALVTGASGLLGRHVVDALAAAGWRLRLIDRVAPDEARRSAAERVEIAELASHDGLAAAMAGVDAVLHLAAIPNLDHHAEADVLARNTASAARVVEAAIEARVGRLVYASSQCVYGYALAPEARTPPFLPADETLPVEPSEGYGLSKRVGEDLCRLFTERTGAPSLALRLPVIWAAERFAEHVAKRAASPEQAAKSWWAYVDARDAAEAFRLAATVALRGAEIVNIGASAPFHGEDAENAARRRFGDLLRDWNGRAPLFAIDKARALIGYSPAYRWTSETVAASSEE